jgi:hypothetical protein
MEATPDNWALIATGEGAECVVVPHARLFEVSHRFMCVCGKPWPNCETEDIRETLVNLGRMLKDEDVWMVDEAGRRFSTVIAEHEIGKIELYAIYSPIPQKENA